MRVHISNALEKKIPLMHDNIAKNRYCILPDLPKPIMSLINPSTEKGYWLAKKNRLKEN